MLKILGFIVALGSVFGGYVASSGYLSALLHINEIWMIMGCAFGAFMVSNTGHVIKHSLSLTKQLFTGSIFSKEMYKQGLLLTYEVLNKLKMSGAKSVEDDFEEPENSELFQKYPLVLKNKRAVEFICDNFRFVIGGSYAPHDMEAYIDNEIDAIKEDSGHAPHAVQAMADGFPAYGIIACVGGVIITMGYINDSVDVIASSIAVALAGTFLGILFGYGCFGPLAGGMKELVSSEVGFYNTLKMGILSHIHGYNPGDGVETARKAMPESVKLTFMELDESIQEIRSGGNGG